ncbi:MAG TPA: DUF5668 domain-containing protein [Bryobacteraceae bacterium]|nr:DUF5668 domain-containing protein [Bryobacteraceae bacterium]
MNGGEPLAGRHAASGGPPGLQDPADRSRYMDERASLARAVRGPVTLITVGVLFALNNFTRYGFDQTWPVLLIVFGLLSLLGRGAQPRHPVPPMPPRQPFPAPSGPPPSSGPSYRQSQYGTENRPGDAQ